MFMPVGTQGALAWWCLMLWSCAKRLSDVSTQLCGSLPAFASHSCVGLTCATANTLPYPPTCLRPPCRLRQGPDQPAAGGAGLPGGAGQHIPPGEQARCGGCCVLPLLLPLMLLPPPPPPLLPPPCRRRRCCCHARLPHLALLSPAVPSCPLNPAPSPSFPPRPRQRACGRDGRPALLHQLAARHAHRFGRLPGGRLGGSKDAPTSLPWLRVPPIPPPLCCASISGVLSPAVVRRQARTASPPPPPQMVSLLHLADITEEGVTFQSPTDGRRMLLTPEHSIQVGGGATSVSGWVGRGVGTTGQHRPSFISSEEWYVSSCRSF